MTGAACCGVQVQWHHSARSPGKPVHLSFRLLYKETDGSRKPVLSEVEGFPSYPCEYMPRSQTPVVSSELAITLLRTAAFPLPAKGRLSSRFTSRLILTSTTIQNPNDLDLSRREQAFVSANRCQKPCPDHKRKLPQSLDLSVFLSRVFPNWDGTSARSTRQFLSSQQSSLLFCESSL
jgi:hypothetical protein